MSKHTWEDVVRECEEILQMNGHANSPLESNLPNVVRDLVYKICGSPAEQAEPCACCGRPFKINIHGVCSKCGHMQPPAA